jgi:hypothetical protein
VLAALIHISANRFVAVYFSVLEILREFEGSEINALKRFFQMYTACSSELTVAAKLLKKTYFPNMPCDFGCRAKKDGAAKS